MSDDQTMCDPTEKTLYQEPHNDDQWTFQDRLYVCGPLPRQGIGISVGGMVYVRPLKAWHTLESERDRLSADLMTAKMHLIDDIGIIDRLRHNLYIAKEEFKQSEKERKELKAKAEKMAGALRDILDYGNALQPGAVHHVTFNACVIAKAALEEIERG